MPWNYCKKNIVEYLQDLVNRKIICGYSCGFIDELENSTYYGGVQGCISPYNNIKIRKGMLYDLASLTKVVATTTRILQLIECGILKEDTLVKDIVNEF